MKTAVKILDEPQRGARRYVVRYYSPPDLKAGRQKRKGKAFRRLQDAKAFAAERQYELIHRGMEPLDEDVTLGNLLAQFEQSRLANLSHSSRIGYANTMNQLKESFGPAKLVREIQVQHAEAFVASRRRVDGGSDPLAAWSRARHLIHCRAIFAAAVEWGAIQRNPFQVERLAGSSPLRIKPKGRPWHHLTPREFVQFLSVVKSAQQRAAYWLMYGCGLRPGEVYNLTINTIDLQRKRVQVVNRAATGDIPPFTIKADNQAEESKERSVPIPDAALSDITTAMKQALTAGGFVVLTPRRFAGVQENWRRCRSGEGWGSHGPRAWQNRDMYNGLLRDTKRLMNRARIKLSAPFSLTTFRKAFAQNHADAGTPPRTLAKLLGHGSTRITMSFYNRVTDANEKAAAEVMSRLLAPPQESNARAGVS